MLENNKYEKGSILKFENKKIGTVIVLGEIIKDDEQYVLVAPYKDIGNDTVITSNSELLLLKVSNNDIYIETEESCVKAMLSEILSEAN